MCALEVSAMFITILSTRARVRRPCSWEALEHPARYESAKSQGTAKNSGGAVKSPKVRLHHFVVKGVHENAPGPPVHPRRQMS